MCIAAARLGLGEEAAQLLDEWIATFFQHNGLTQAWDSRYITMEPIATDAHTVTTAISEMLLQSYSGKIRVFPAVPPRWPACRFARLRAAGAFLVSAERRDRATAYVAVESLAGRPCSVVNPWPEEPVRIKDLRTGDVTLQRGAEIRFPTAPGGRYLLSRGDAAGDPALPEWPPSTPALTPRQIAAGKYFGLRAAPAGKPFAGSEVGEPVHVEAINDGTIREIKKWPGPVHLPADSVCRIEPLYNDEPFQAHFGIEYGAPRQVRKITAWAASGYCSVFGGARLSWIPKSYVCQTWNDGRWVDIPGTRIDGNQAFPIVHEFDPVTTTRIRLLITRTGTGVFARTRAEPRKPYHNAAIMELEVEASPLP
jgi:hypothetical protein